MERTRRLGIPSFFSGVQASHGVVKTAGPRTTRTDPGGFSGAANTPPGGLGTQARKLDDKKTTARRPRTPSSSADQPTPDNRPHRKPAVRHRDTASADTDAESVAKRRRLTRPVIDDDDAPDNGTISAPHPASGSDTRSIIQAIADKNLEPEHLRAGLPGELFDIFRDPDEATRTWTTINTRSTDRIAAAARFATSISKLIDSELKPEAAKEPLTQQRADILVAITLVRLAEERLDRQIAWTSACNEAGAFCALLSRIYPHWPSPTIVAGSTSTIGWPRTEMAKRAMAGGHHKGPIRTSKGELPPALVTVLLDKLDPERALDDETSMLAAAVALASAFSLPVTMTTHIRVDEVEFIVDPVHQSATTLGYSPREGKKTERRLAPSSKAKKPTRKIWAAAATPTLHDFLRPWHARCYALKWTYLFSETDGKTPCTTKHLQAFLKQLTGDKSSTWHALRVGTARALQLAHTVDGELGASEPVSLEVQNQLQMRSNSRIKGSKDIYDQTLLEPMLCATRYLHLVEKSAIGDLATCRRIQGIPPPSAATCDICECDIGLNEPGTYCDAPTTDCRNVACTSCIAEGSVWICDQHAHGTQRRRVADDDPECDRTSSATSDST